MIYITYKKRVLGENEAPDMLAMDPHSSAQLLLFILLGLLLSQLAETILHRYHVHAIPGSGAVMLIGILTGFIMAGINREWEAQLEFDEHLFALILLPIIIFQSGYSLPLSHFFKRLFKILVYAFVGTGITTLFVGLSLFGISETGVLGENLKFGIWEAMAFASLISAIDPVATLCTFGALQVEPSLSITIMGESVINDAVSLALYKTFEHFIEAGEAVHIGGQIIYFLELVIVSSILGVLTGMLCSFQLRQIPIRIGVNMQATAILLWSYVAYAISEAFGLSGIISSISAGIIMNHYCKKNLLMEQREYIDKLLAMMANFCEMAIFYMAGISIAFYSRVAEYQLLLIMIPLVLVGRALNVFPLSWLLNRSNTADKITFNEQVVMWHAGLRGAIAFSIALHFPQPLRDAVIDCTSQIILLSIFILGGTTSKVLNRMNIQCGDSVKDTHAGHVKAVKEAVGNSKFKSALRSFDKSYVEKYLVKQKMRSFDDFGRETDGNEHDGESLLSFGPEKIELKGGGGSISYVPTAERQQSSLSVHDDVASATQL